MQCTRSFLHAILKFITPRCSTEEEISRMNFDIYKSVTHPSSTHLLLKKISYFLSLALGNGLTLNRQLYQLMRWYDVSKYSQSFWFCLFVWPLHKDKGRTYKEWCNVLVWVIMKYYTVIFHKLTHSQ